MFNSMTTSRACSFPESYWAETEVSPRVVGKPQNIKDAKEPSQLAQKLKDFLVIMGQDNPMVHAVLKIHARRAGFHIDIDSTIAIERRSSRMLLKKSHFMFVPFMMEVYDQCFADFEPKSADSIAVLDFSGPTVYRDRDGREFYFQAIRGEDADTA